MLISTLHVILPNMYRASGRKCRMGVMNMSVCALQVGRDEREESDKSGCTGRGFVHVHDMSFV